MYSVLLLMPLRRSFFPAPFLTIILIDLFNDLTVFLFTELYCTVLSRYRVVLVTTCSFVAWMIRWKLMASESNWQKLKMFSSPTIWWIRQVCASQLHIAILKWYLWDHIYIFQSQWLTCHQPLHSNLSITSYWLNISLTLFFSHMLLFLHFFFHICLIDDLIDFFCFRFILWSGCCAGWEAFSLH